MCLQGCPECKQLWCVPPAWLCEHQAITRDMCTRYHRDLQMYQGFKVLCAHRLYRSAPMISLSYGSLEFETFRGLQTLR